ncbi:MAG TPA: GTP 3',8-cyclase MoaA [Methanobacteriales archaeon]|nr:GTP 3',8-cyclase MoaA [Methanobacteriaceae archaeon]MBC7097172.1 GTP 3',8-cyclase MoaA [Methanobacteriales archaeon]HIH61420.1 GTP 3',8-cyclase MoaA [Methanobacteriales archaeon]
MKIYDNYNRPVTSLRISITTKCNLNCFYCHRDGIIPSSREMTADEIEKICEVASQLGITKIRLSGGEPLLRDDIITIIEKINAIGFKDIAITTNGILLEKYSNKLKKAGLNRINVSLDTLNPTTYKFITGKNQLEKVKRGIKSAVMAGLYPIKINMVIMKGINSHEIWEMFQFCRQQGAILQLIELLETEQCSNNGLEKYHYNFVKIEKKLAKIADRVKTRNFMQDRKKYYIDGGEIEIVKPMDNTRFCENCTRMRITPEGKLKPCLLRNDNLIDAKQALQQGNLEKLRRLFIEAIKRRCPYYLSKK